MDVLLVDDNADFLMQMKDLLFQNGYCVTTCTYGDEACEILTAFAFDLIISDIKMPRYDGIKLHAFVREMSKHKRTKFIFLSGYKESYSNVLQLDPEIDFLLDKSTSTPEAIRFINELMFGKFVGMWG